jgi:pimeloyl-ACP methyl ester carboxylesterase
MNTHTFAERRALLKAMLAAPLLALPGCAGSSRTGSGPQASVAELGGGGFRSHIARANGARLHYVRGGDGPALFLLHGFPQDWFAFHDVMPRLAQRFTVIAVDTRGVGGSSGPIDRYDAATLARDILELARGLGFDTLYVAGHDNGGMIAYAFARTYATATRAAFILECPIPGVEPWSQIKADPAVWHFAFHQTPNLPEQLVAGRQKEYFRSFFDRLTHHPEAISDAELEHYMHAYGSLSQLRAGFAFYRQCYPALERSSALDHARSEVPLILVGGDRSLGPVNPQLALALQRRGWQNVSVETLEDSGHWILDEQPQAVASIIERHASV